MPEISVIVPVYEVEKYLRECIDSILKQTFTDFELILIDDGSTDGSEKICDEYKIKDSRIKVIHQKNAGVSAARNTGLDIAKGKYISFVDSDDVVNRYYLAILYEKLIEFQADISICEMEEFNDEKEAIILIDKNIIKGDLRRISGREAVFLVYSSCKKRISVVSCAKLYKKSLFENVRFPVGKRHEDDAVTPILLHKSKTVVWYPAMLYGYRQRTHSFTHEKFNLRRYDAIDAINRCILYFNEMNEFELAAAAEKCKEVMIAYYALLSRKAGIYKDVPQEYQKGRIEAIRIMKTLLPYNVYSYKTAQVYPGFIFVEAHIRRLFQMLGIVKL